jgi:hypothetical protein
MATPQLGCASLITSTGSESDMFSWHGSDAKLQLTRVTSERNESLSGLPALSAALWLDSHVPVFHSKAVPTTDVV